MRRSLNFNHLEVFFTLTECLSFSKTSEKLHIAQPSISKQIKMLEEYFDTQLFVRNNKYVSLTKEGKAIYEKLKTPYSEILTQADNILLPQKELSGKIVFACFSEIGERFFIKHLLEFKKQHPLVAIEIQFLKGEEIIQGVKKGTIDIGIVSDEISAESVRCYQYYQENILLVTNANNKMINLDGQIAPLRFVTYRDQDPLFNLYLKKLLPKHKRTNYKIDFTVNSHKSMVQTLLSDNYFAVLPYLSVENEIKSGKLLPVGGLRIKSPLYLIHHEVERGGKLMNELKFFLNNIVKI